MCDWIGIGGRVAVVTGAGAGIGEGIALALAAVGATLVLLDCDEAAAIRVVVGSRERRGEAFAVACAVSDQAWVAAAADRSNGLTGLCNILANNAGYHAPGGLGDLKLSEWNQRLAVNLTGCLLCGQAFGGQMLRRRRGSLVNIASVSAHALQGFSSAYSVSKAGVLMLSRQLAVEWGPNGARSNVVSPGLIRTPMTEPTYRAPGVLEQRQEVISMQRIGQPEDIGNAVAFLASDRSSYVNGSKIVVDGGFSQTVMGDNPATWFREDKARSGLRSSKYSAFSGVAIIIVAFQSRCPCAKLVSYTTLMRRT